MPLDRYRGKRDFGNTPEPDGSGAAPHKGGRPIFVVQLHHARSRHYDFRLEVDGVLKSWAVPKGPSLRVGEKRLAIQVEDHPLDYATFEGTIPQGQYGAGEVTIFDHGVWSAEGDPLAALASGKLEITLHGQKLKGGWKLIRTSARAQAPQWLLLKLDDPFSADREADDLLGPPPRPAHGRRARHPAQQSHWQRRALALKGARQGALPQLPQAQLTTLHARPPHGQEWLHELKWDGYRMLAQLRFGQVLLRSRNGRDWSDDHPDISAALGALGPDDAMFDGELIALDAMGHSDFHALQQTIAGTSSAPLRYVLFDLLQLAGVDLTGCQLIDRKTLLQSLLAGQPGDSPLVYSQHTLDHVDEFWRMTRQQGMEGIVSKRLDAPYRAGRSTAWIKAKHIHSDDFIVIGATAPQGSRKGFGALLLASRQAGRLEYVGRVGSGFDDATLRTISARLAPWQRRDAPVSVPAAQRRQSADIHWYEPRLVVEVAFRGYSRDGLLRQASFMRAREDKNMADLGTASTPSISSPQRCVYPDSGLTKQDVADYYVAIAPLLLPGVVRRPLSLLRCPQGITADCFFQKHHAGHLGGHVHAVSIAKQSGNKGQYLYIEDSTGLLELVQMNVLELHPWGACVDEIERPDRLVLDLDPHEDVAWPEVIAAARELRDLLHGLGLESFVRLSGGKGLHLVIPIRPEKHWPEVRQFCESFAKALASHAPARYVATAAKKERTGRIFIDWQRNTRGSTSIASWSLRARRGAPVAVPLRWSELGSTSSGADYPMARALRRASSLRSDPWQGWEKATRQALYDISDLP